MSNKLLSIDPGLSIKPGGSGWCLFPDGLGFNLMPEQTGIISPSARMAAFGWEVRADYVLEQLEYIFIVNHTNKTTDGSFSGYPNYFLPSCTDVYIELPTFFSSVKGMTAATGKDGGESDIMKLIVLAGRMLQMFKDNGFQKVEFVRVSEWKGTMSKTAVESRIKRRLGLDELPFSAHAVDACGIGLYKKGVFSALR